MLILVGMVDGCQEILRQTDEDLSRTIFICNCFRKQHAVNDRAELCLRRLKSHMRTSEGYCFFNYRKIRQRLLSEDVG